MQKGATQGCSRGDVRMFYRVCLLGHAGQGKKLASWEQPASQGPSSGDHDTRFFCPAGPQRGRPVLQGAVGGVGGAAWRAGAFQALPPAAACCWHLRCRPGCPACGAHSHVPGQAVLPCCRLPLPGETLRPAAGLCAVHATRCCSDQPPSLSLPTCLPQVITSTRDTFSDMFDDDQTLM